MSNCSSVKTQVTSFFGGCVYLLIEQSRGVICSFRLPALIEVVFVSGYIGNSVSCVALAGPARVPGAHGDMLCLVTFGHRSRPPTEMAVHCF